MTNQDRLARTYGGLLHAYPRRYRRARRDEMLSTLLDGAPPDRRWPTLAEASDLVIGGLRCHFQLPRGVAYQVIALLVGMTVGLTFAASASWLAWAGSPEPISVSTATALAHEAMPREPAGGPVSYQDPRSLILGEAAGGYSVAAAPELPRIEFRYPGGDVAEGITMLAAAHERLLAEGWDAQPLDENSASDFWASRGDARMWVGYYATGQDLGVGVVVHGGLPVAVPLAAIIGLLIGLVVGWLWTGWAVRRYQRHAPAARAFMVIVTAPILVIALVTIVVTAGYGISVAFTDGWSWSDPIQIATAMMRAIPTLGLLLGGLLVASVVAARAPEGPEHGQPFTAAQTMRYGARAAASVHLLIAAGFAAILVWYLATLHGTGGDRSGMLTNRYDPKDHVPFGDSPLNPIGALLVPAELSFLIGWLLSPAWLTVSLPLLAVSWRSTGWRTRGLVVVAALTAVALPALVFSPTGSDAATWLAD
jgi:hypothetical protein